MSSAAQVLFNYVQQHNPDVYIQILEMIRPHSIKSLIFHFDQHLKKSVPDLDIFNRHLEGVPKLCLEFARAVRKRFPTPGDAFGIQLTCRVTKFDTQGVLDSKHLKGSTSTVQHEYNVEYSIRNELQHFSSQTHVFEFNSKHRYYTAFLKPTNTEDIFEKLANMVCVLERGMDHNKGRDKNGELKYLDTFLFIFVASENKILYRTVHNLQILFKRLDSIEAISDISYVSTKCGIVSHYFNLVRILRRQLFSNSDSTAWERDILTIVKYQCRSGIPLPLNRDGLAKNTTKSPIEVLSFEAPKKNFARLCTMEDESTKCYPVETSSDKIFFGQQFNEGTGYSGFAIRESKD